MGTEQNKDEADLPDVDLGDVPEDARTGESWAPLTGVWESGESDATYIGPSDPQIPFGLAISDERLRSGIIWTNVTLPSTKDSGRIAFGFGTVAGSYFSIGIGHEQWAYFLDAYIPNRGWIPLWGAGDHTNLKPGQAYALQVNIHGSVVSMEVDGIEVLTHDLPNTPIGDQVGLVAWGSGPVAFSEFLVLQEPPQAFVLMEFGEPFDTLYGDVIRPVGEDEDFVVVRADDVFQPGIIMADVLAKIERAAVIVAEITPANPNVYYELGWAHARGKATILLAQKGSQLPFDVSGHRCIFYDDSIGGKKQVEDALRRHLQSFA